jgi:hypothetical protein
MLEAIRPVPSTDAARTRRLLLGPLIASVVALRLYLHLVDSTTNLMVLGHEVHHLFTGTLVALPAAFALAFRPEGGRRDLALVALGVGSGLILDELVFLVATPGTDAAYLQPVSVRGAVVSVALAVLLIVALSR